MKQFYLYNTLSRKEELLEPLFPPRVRIYTCGPTVYDHTHLGHMRTYTNTDILIRTLSYLGYQPYQVMNITDVGHLLGDGDLGEDKMEAAAKKRKKTAREIAREYEEEFFHVLKKLNIKRPQVTPRATENIAEMILLVQELERRGFTYKTKDGIYFDTAKLADYGKLSGMPLEKLVQGARVEVNKEKRNPTDFALWKFTPPGVKRQMEWASPWGERTFPGWHIECSTMAMKYLSDCFSKGKFFPEKFETIDIHTGGIDHIPVHHTNEIAQSEAATGKKFVNYWMHNEFLEVEGKKMSKSLGNFYTLYDLKSRGYHDLMSLRYLFLNTHYRKKMNFTWPALAAAKRSYQKIVGFLRRAAERSQKEQLRNQEKEKSYISSFVSFLAHDLRAPRALAVFNEALNDSQLPPASHLFLAYEMDRVLGLNLKRKIQEKDKKENIPLKIRNLVKKREMLRKKGDFATADALREKVEKEGFLINDTPSGPQIVVKEKDD